MRRIAPASRLRRFVSLALCLTLAFGAILSLLLLPLWPPALPEHALPDLPATGAAVLGGVAEPRLLRSDSDVFLVANRTRRWVTSLRVFDDYRFRWEQVEQISFDALGAIPRGPDLVAGPVVRDPAGQTWIVLDGRRRAIAGADAFFALALSPADAVSVPSSVRDSYPAGRPVGIQAQPLHGALVGLALVLGGTIVVAEARHRRAGLALAAVMTAGAALKLRFALLFPWWTDGADGPAYESLARYLAGGGSWLVDGPNSGLTGVTAPGYPMLLALVSAAARLAGDGVLIWKVAQVGLAIALVPLAAALARRTFGSRAARVALVIASLSPVWFLAAEVIQYEIWLAYFIAAGVWATFRAEESPARPHLWAALAGLALGLACLVQLKLIVVGAALVLYAGWRLRAVLPVLLFVAMLALPVTAWVVRNYVVHQEIVIGTTGPAPMLWVGNHLGATGGYQQLPRPDRLYDFLNRYPPDSLTREARAFADLGWEVIRQYPSHFAHLALIKLERFWWSLPPGRYGAFSETRMDGFLGLGFDGRAQNAVFKLLNTFTLLTVVAGLVGGARLADSDGVDPRAARRRWLIAGIVLVFWVIHVPFISEPRYRISVMPLVHLFQAAGVLTLTRAILSLRQGGIRL